MGLAIKGIKTYESVIFNFLAFIQGMSKFHVSPMYTGKMDSKGWLSRLKDIQTAYSSMFQKRHVLLLNQVTLIATENFILRFLLLWVQEFFSKANNFIWKESRNFSIRKFVTLVKVTLLHGCFSRFLKFYKWYRLPQSHSYYRSTEYNLCS